MPPTEEARRKQLCDHLGREALALRGAAGAAHQVLLPWLTPPPPSTPDLPFGMLWGLINHLKVLHQNVLLLGQAACQGPHGEPLFPTPEARKGLKWFDPSPLLRDDAEAEVRGLLRAWCSAHHDAPEEAAYHMHQAGEDMGLPPRGPPVPRPPAPALPQRVRGGHRLQHPPGTAGLLRRLSGPAGELAQEGPVPPPLPGGAQHAYGKRLGAEGADDWQDLLTEFNQKRFCSSHRMEAFLERLEDRSAMLSNRICSSTRPCRPLEESIRRLIFLKSHPDQYDTCLEVCGGG